MIYRIAIYKHSKFVRYATQEERYWLRINSSGLVQKVKNGLSQLFRGWFDVSKTHKVEWGIEFNGVKIFENDITTFKHTYVNIDPFRKDEPLDKYHVAAYVVEQANTGQLMLKCFAIIENHNCGDFVYRGIGKMHELRYLGDDLNISGNVHQNPELLEAK